MTKRGEIVNKKAYAQSKMLNNASWQEGEKRLRNNITPSDIDNTFDNNAWIIFMELDRTLSKWSQLEKGQRLLYENVIINSHHCAVICKHNVPIESEVPIDTRTDIVSFQPMVFHSGCILTCPVWEGNDWWQEFVFRWFEDSEKVRHNLICHADQSKPVDRRSAHDKWNDDVYDFVTGKTDFAPMRHARRPL